MFKFSKILVVILSIKTSLSFCQQWEDVGSTTISPAASSFNNLAIDLQGNYYVSYYDLSVSKGSVQKFNGNSWSHLGGNPGITTSSATYSSLSLDSSGDVYYTNQWAYPNSGMEVKKFSGNTWTQLSNAFNTTTNYQASAVAPDNTLFVYGSVNSGTVKRFVNGIWEQVGMSGIAGSTPINAEMVIGSNGKVYVCHNASGIKVFENSLIASSTDAWTLTGGAPVGMAFTEGANATSDIAIAKDNSLYVVYSSTAANNRKLNVKKFDGTTWVQIGNPDFGISNNLYNVSIAVTPMGKPYIAASGWAVNGGKNTVYTLDSASNTWTPFGGDFVSDGTALYNDLHYDPFRNTLVLTYSQNGVKVKSISVVSSTCNNVDPSTTPGDLGCITFNYGAQSVNYVTVRGRDGKIWLQQNLGSTKVAESITDSDAYGDLFQWGRWNDGHQLRSSSLSSTAPSPNNPLGINNGVPTFYSAAYNSSSNFWSNGLASDTWTAESIASVTATNGADPCKKIGLNWRLPTVDEINSVITAENITDYNSALSSNLKLIPAGMKDYNGIFSPGTRLYLWSSSSSPYNGSAQHFYISQYSALSNSAGRDAGMSVRCIKDMNIGLGTSEIKKAALSIYPNPTKGIIYIKTDSEVETLNVTNTLGQRINVQFSNNQFNIQDLPKGIYLIELHMQNGQKISKKIIKD